MKSPERLIPTLVRTKTFKVFERYHLKDGRWVLAVCESSNMEELVNNWIEETHAHVQQVSAPSVAMYNEGSELRLLIVGLSLTYFASSERTNDDYGQSNADVGHVAGPVQSKPAKSTDVYEPPQADRDPDVASGDASG